MAHSEQNPTDARFVSLESYEKEYFKRLKEILVEVKNNYLIGKSKSVEDVEKVTDFLKKAKFPNLSCRKNWTVSESNETQAASRPQPSTSRVDTAVIRLRHSDASSSGEPKNKKSKPSRNSLGTNASPMWSNFQGASASPSPPQSSTQRSWNPLSLVLCSSFEAKFTSDEETPVIKDAKILGGCLIILTDMSKNQCLKLFSIEDKNVLKKKKEVFKEPPLCIAVFDKEASHPWDVAVTMQNRKAISVMKLTYNDISTSSTIALQKRGHAIAATNNNLFAVGHYNMQGIDMIDSCGKKEDRPLSQTVRPKTLSSSSSGNEIVGIDIGNSDIVKWNTQNGQEMFRKSVHPIRPVSICSGKDKLLVADKKSIHLYDATNCNYIKNLWEKPSENREPVVAVTYSRNIVVCATKRGTIYVLESVL